MVGYTIIMSVAAIRKANTTITEKMVDASTALQVQTPFGTITYRAIDQQSTMGAFVGKTDLKDGKGMMVNWVTATVRNTYRRRRSEENATEDARK